MTSNPLVPVPAAEPAIRPAQAPRQRPSHAEIAAWILVGAFLIYVLMLHMVSALIGGLALYLILDKLAQSMSRRIPGMAARTTSIIIVTLIAGGIIIGATAMLISFLQHQSDTLPAMMRQMADILRSTRLWLGGYGRQVIPDFMTDAESFKVGMVDWLKNHAGSLRMAGSTFSVGLLHIFMGTLLAVVVFFRHVTHFENRPSGPLASYLTEKADRFSQIFARIAGAQIKVSLFNTFITALYLMTLLLLGRQIPFMTTLILITFILGLVPIVGNVVTNAVLVILSLGVSGGTAIVTLVFVLAISKLQYVLTSRLVGSEVDSQAWEILLAIIVGEAAFGLAGVVIAPVVYAFIKGELREYALV
jgi:predicted PurR-regulated permease PerM